MTSAELIGTALTYVMDTREKIPYQLPDAKLKRLAVGDYTIEGFEDVLAVERKGYDDLFSCLTSKVERFTRQLKSLSRLKYKALCVDTTVTAMKLGHVFAPITGEDAIQRLISLCVDHDIPVFFCDRHGSTVCQMFLYSAWKRLMKEEK